MNVNKNRLTGRQTNKFAVERKSIKRIKFENEIQKKKNK